MAKKTTTAQLRAAALDLAAAVEHAVAALKIGHTETLRRLEAWREITRAGKRARDAVERLGAEE